MKSDEPLRSRGQAPVPSLQMPTRVEEVDDRVNSDPSPNSSSTRLKRSSMPPSRLFRLLEQAFRTSPENLRSTYQCTRRYHASTRPSDITD